jgi:hypothetical protein
MYKWIPSCWFLLVLGVPLYGDGRATGVNLNLDNAGSATYKAGSQFQPPIRTYAIVAEGTPNSILSPRGEVISPVKLAQMLLTNTSYGYRPGTPIVLYACSTGEGTTNFASALAQLLGTSVTAPNDIFWWVCNKTGRVSYIIAPSQYYSPTGRPIRAPNGTWQMDTNRLGAMVTFQPKTR